MTDFQKEIKAALEEYADVANDVLQEAIEKSAKEAVKELKKTSPKRKGTYAKSWKQKVVSQTLSTVQRVIYASGHQYSITHLLEKGHAKRGGGRVKGYPHIAAAEKNAAERVLKELRSGL